MSAKIIGFPSKARDRAARRDLPTLEPSKNTMAAIAARVDEMDDQFHFIRMRVRGYVTSWRELFAVARQREQEFYNRVKPASKLLGQDIAEQQKDALYFWDRCAQIYDEEMQEAERLAAEARHRAALRIEKEFGDPASGIPQALRDNAPQRWAFQLDLN